MFSLRNSSVSTPGGLDSPSVSTITWNFSNISSSRIVMFVHRLLPFTVSVSNMKLPKSISSKKSSFSTVVCVCVSKQNTKVCWNGLVHYHLVHWLHVQWLVLHVYVYAQRGLPHFIKLTGGLEHLVEMLDKLLSTKVVKKENLSWFQWSYYSKL